MVLCHVVSFLCRDASAARSGQPPRHLCDRCEAAASLASTSARKCACLASRQASVLDSRPHRLILAPRASQLSCIDEFWSLLVALSQLQKRGSDCAVKKMIQS